MSVYADLCSCLFKSILQSCTVNVLSVKVYPRMYSILLCFDLPPLFKHKVHLRDVQLSCVRPRGDFLLNSACTNDITHTASNSNSTPDGHELVSERTPGDDLMCG